MSNVITLLWVVFPLVAVARYTDKRENSLVLVHVLFRHGDRTPDDASDIYKADPYKDYEYYPHGKGQLTVQGKRTEYNIGVEIRRRYGDFLGSVYTPDLVDARSSDVNRTKMSLQLVLAALFPPTEKEQWEPSLAWQPIPYTYAPIDKDPLLFPYKCPNFDLYMEEYKQTPEYKNIERNYTALMGYLTAHTGVKYKDFSQLFFLTALLEMQKEFGLTLPKWADKIYPQPITEGMIEFYHQLTATSNLRKLISGHLLEKIIMDTTAKIYNEKSSKNKKLYLYAGHEYNIAALLSTLGIVIHEVPPYGAYLAVEIHNLTDTYGLKLFYQNYNKTDPIQLKLPACAEMCPFDEFVDAVVQNFPAPNQCGCKAC